MSGHSEAGLQRAMVVILFLLLTEAAGDPTVFCYRMGVHILSAGGARFLAPATALAAFADKTRNQFACSTLFSTLSARFSTPKD